MSTYLFAAGGALVVLALAFHFHWFSEIGRGESRWAGWAATGCMAGAMFCLIVAGRMVR